MRLDFTRPGKPMDDPFIESFNGGLLDEHLNIELFLHVSVRACVAFLQQFFLVMPVCPAPASCRNHGRTRCRIFALHP